MAASQVEVVLEIAAKRSFASAVDWPGWCRAGRTPDDALVALAAYAPRYAMVARHARVRFPARAGDHLQVVEEVPGNATTDFGAPGVPGRSDERPLPAAAADRQARLLEAAWAALERLAVEAPEQLRKGPRGGGRDRDAIVEHVVESERRDARMIGVRHPPYTSKADVTACRDELAAVLRAARSGQPLRDRGWTARYFLRRATWHVLDHVWEIEDKS